MFCALTDYFAEHTKLCHVPGGDRQGGASAQQACVEFHGPCGHAPVGGGVSTSFLSFKVSVSYVTCYIF